MDHVAVLFEHVDLLDRLDRLDVEFLERGLQLLVVCAGGLVDLFDFSPGSAFASVVKKGGLAGYVAALWGSEGRRRSVPCSWILC